MPPRLGVAVAAKKDCPARAATPTPRRRGWEALGSFADYIVAYWCCDIDL